MTLYSARHWCCSPTAKNTLCPKPYDRVAIAVQVEMLLEKPLDACVTFAIWKIADRERACADGLLCLWLINIYSHKHQTHHTPRAHNAARMQLIKPLAHWFQTPSHWNWRHKGASSRVSGWHQLISESFERWRFCVWLGFNRALLCWMYENMHSREWWEMKQLFHYYF